MNDPYLISLLRRVIKLVFLSSTYQIRNKIHLHRSKLIVILKTSIRLQVYGAGYPSLPVLSVDEFYEQKYGKDGKSGENSHCP